MTPDDGIAFELVDRDIAKFRGLTRYCTGRACGKGHFAQRHVVDKKCVECKRIKRKHQGKETRIKLRAAFEALRQLGISI